MVKNIGLFKILVLSDKKINTLTSDDIKKIKQLEINKNEYDKISDSYQMKYNTEFICPGMVAIPELNKSEYVPYVKTSEYDPLKNGEYFIEHKDGKLFYSVKVGANTLKYYFKVGQNNIIYLDIDAKKASIFNIKTIL
jgi:hypothetical protein